MNPAERFHRALVTGGAGFVGSHLVDRLITAGVEVICVDNFVTSGAANLDHLRADARLSVIEHDIVNPLTWPEPIDLVFHLASLASPADYRKLPVATLKVGSIGTLHALDLALEHHARFVLTSTSEVYGDPLVHPQPENYWGNVNPTGPRSCYDESKRFAEALATAYGEHHGLKIAIARIFNTFGPRMRPGDGRAVPAFITQALAGKPLTVHGDGSQTRSLCYVDDMVDGLLALAASKESEPVNLGNPDEITVLELARRVIELTGSASPIHFVPRPPEDPSRRRPEIARARATLGWSPSIPTDTGLTRTIAWFRQHLQPASAP